MHLTVLVFSSPLTSTIPPQPLEPAGNLDQNNGQSQQRLNPSVVFYFYNNNKNIADIDYVSTALLLIVGYYIENKNIC